MSLRTGTIGLILLLATPLTGAIRFDISGVIETTTGPAFGLGDPVSISLQTRFDLGAPNRENSTSAVWWTHDTDTDSPIWGRITLSGATGTWTDFLSGDDPLSDIEASSSGDLDLYAANQELLGSGLFVSGEEINYIEAGFNGLVPLAGGFTGDIFLTPDSFFTTGSFAFDPGGYFYLETSNSTHNYSIDATSLTITLVDPGVIPEPAHTAMVFGVVGLAFLLCRSARRR